MRSLKAISIVLLAVFGLAACSESGDQVVDYRGDDTVMNAAMDEARSTLPAFLNEMEAGRGDFSVKVPVKDAGYTEHMWMANIRLAGGKFHGQIANEPVTVKTVKLGDRYSIEKVSISDWMIQRDGGIYGGYTLRVMLDDLPGEQAASLRARLRDLK